MEKKRQIFGIGGNFYVEPWQPPLLQRHLLALVEAEEPCICFLGTANGDSASDIERFYRTMDAYRCRVTHLNMFAPHRSDFAAFFLEQDIIYVGGGATRNLIAIWREWGLEDALREAWQAGVLLAGTSAGSICWFETCITDSLPEKLLPLHGLGFVAGSNCTHYDARPDRPVRFRELIASGQIASPGLALEDDVAVHLVDGLIHEVVSAVKGKKAYVVSKDRSGWKEEEIETRFLGETNASPAPLAETEDA